MKMRVFIYEYVTGGGMWESLAARSPADSGLLREARTMVRAIVADFCQIPGTEVWSTRDARLPELHPLPCQVTRIASSAEERRALERLAVTADWTLLIAPESGGALTARCELVERARGRLLSPSPEVVLIAGNKQLTAELLASHNVPVPRGTLLSAGCSRIPDGIGFPAVIKPMDGCGSEGVRMVRSADGFPRTIDRPMRCEEFVPGLAVSVAVLCGPAGNHSLPACQQRLSAEGRFSYFGGRLPLASPLDQRARQLAEAGVAALPQPRGYIGVDLVVGDAADGSGDRVIEINPRLTTSYVGLRVAAKTNLAAAMLAVVQGDTPDLSFRPEPVEFAADGTIYNP